MFVNSHSNGITGKQTEAGNPSRRLRPNQRQEHMRKTKHYKAVKRYIKAFLLKVGNAEAPFRTNNKTKKIVTIGNKTPKEHNITRIKKLANSSSAFHLIASFPSKSVFISLPSSALVSLLFAFIIPKSPLR